MPEHEPRIAAFYGRVSGKDEESIETQLAIAIEVAARDGYIIPDGPAFRFADVRVSGLTRTRNGWSRLLQVIQGPEKPPFERVYVRNLQRLGRWKDPRRFPHYEVLFEDAGAPIRYCEQERQIEFSDGIRASDVGVYISDTVDMVRTSRDHTDLVNKFRTRRRQMVLQGFYPSGHAPYGYMFAEVDPDTRAVLGFVRRGSRTRTRGSRLQLVPADDGSAELVRSIFRWAGEGMSMLRIAKRLIAEAARMPRGSSDWDVSTLSALLRHPIYKGCLIWGQWGREDLDPVPNTQAKIEDIQPIRYDGFVAEPLISPEEFDRIQEILNGRAGRWNHRRACEPRHLLTGRLFCAACGLPINGALKKSARGTVYYIHPETRKCRPVPCEYRHKSVRADALEPQVLAHVRTLLQNPALQAAVRAQMTLGLSPEADSMAHEVETLARRLEDRKVEQRRTRAVLAQLTSDSAVSEFASHVNALGKQIDEIKRQLQDLEQKKVGRDAVLQQRLAVLDQADRLVALLDEGSFASRRAVVERAVASVEYDYATHTATLTLRLI
jgi:hypothetical protein